MADEHLDLALAEEFAGKGEVIHKLKVSNAHFKGLMEKNHTLWSEIQQIQNNVKPASDERLEDLRKQRLALLDEIASMIDKG